MAYAINVRIQHNNPSNRFSIVEKTNWHFAEGGYWTECDGEHTLHMGGSGTSGMLRFRNGAGEFFLVALGVHNYKRWCDIVTDAASTDTGVVINPQYYTEGDSSGRDQMLWKQLAHLEKTTSSGVQVTVDYYSEDGNNLYATITIA